MNCGNKNEKHVRKLSPQHGSRPKRPGPIKDISELKRCERGVGGVSFKNLGNPGKC